MKYWSKSAVSIYKYLMTMSDTLDKVILDLGKNSNSTMMHKYNSTYFQANKIIELMDRKRKMVNLKVAVEDAVNRLSKVNKRIITLVYFDGVKSEVVAKLLGISIRTFFRKKINALKEFTTILQGLGYDEDFFENEYFNENWFMSVYDNNICKGCESEDSLDRYLVKKVFNEVSKINLNYNVYLD